MRTRTLVMLALAAALAAHARGQEASGEPVTGVPGVPDASGVLDMREPPEQPGVSIVPTQGKSIHAPLPRPARGAAPAPEALPAAAPAPAPAVSPAPQIPSPMMDEDFEAAPDNMLVIPPDTYGAVGPNHLLATLNSIVRVQDRSGSTLLDRTLDQFWISVGGGSGAFDPRAFYDPYADRWVVVSCDDVRAASSGILLAASDGGDPTLTWHTYKVDADTTNTLWADFPSVGFNSRWVVVQVNMFRISNDQFVRSHIYVFDRAALYAGSAPFTLIQDVTGGFTQAPARTYDMTQTDLYLLEEWSAAAGQLRLSKISGPVASPALSVVGFAAGGSWVALPPTPDYAPQNDPPLFRKIAANDDRIQSLVFRNSKLWTAHTVFFSTPVGRASVQWWQLDPTGPTVLQRGLVDDPTGTNLYAFPSLAVNKLDDALIGFSCFAQSRFASACSVFRRASDPPNTFRDVATMKEGLAKYYKTFAGPSNRWGDYSATQVDPANDIDLWTIQEYAMQPSGSDRWGTWWGHLALPPDITINDVSLAEGNAGTTNARFTVSLSFPSTQTVEVDWAAADGTATLADSDYLAAGGHLTFPPGTVSLPVDVPVVGDLNFEPDETFVVNLTNPVNAAIADAQGVGTILNDDGTPQLSIDDVRVVEGDAGTTGAIFTTTLSSLSSLTVQAAWSTSNGTAVAPGDYVSNSGTLVFSPGVTSQTLTVQVVGDTVAEPTETFQVDLGAPLNATLAKSRGVGTILDNDGPNNPGVSFLTVVSGGATGATSGHNRLQWVNPVGGSPTEMRIRFNKGIPCTLPSGPDDVTSFGVFSWVPVAPPGSVESFDHLTLDLDTTYCYTVWVIHSGAVASPGASVSGRPFNATGNLRWKYTTGTGTTGVAPPTVSFDGVFAVDNSGELHAMNRSGGGGGGDWPAPAWYPVSLGAASQARNPIVPLSFGSRAFISTQDGSVRAVDTKTGAVAWTTALSPVPVTAAPAGIFSAFQGEHDAILVGTSTADNNVFHALDPATGSPLTSYGFPANPGIGAISGIAAVDYGRAPQNRVYFASRRGTRTETLWCLELGPAGPLAFSLKWRVDVGNISGSPVLRNGRIYVGTDAGEVLSVRADDGGNILTTGPLGDGPVKGFVFPDRASGDVYASTNTKVWRLTDTGTGWTTQWGVPVPNPSIPLLWPGTTHVFVGGDDGQLYQLETPTGAIRSIALDFDPPAFVVGAPSLDLGFNLVHVGSVRGVFYAVQVPLP